MKRIRHFLYLLFHPKAWKIYREFKRYPRTSNDDLMEKLELEKALQKITPKDIQKALKDKEIEIR